MIGQTIGDYRLTEKLGEGGFGVVYKGVHRLLEQEVAIKTLDPVLTRDPKFRQRFFEEAKTQARLNHPNIVTLHNFFEHDGQYFLVMEFMGGVVLPGGTLARNIGDLVSLGPVPEARVRDIFGEVLAGVAFAHSRGVLHRDIKPLNLLFSEAGIAKVADFGIAKIIGGDTNVSMSGTRVGTPAYMSPEQVLNRPLDRRTDIYSLGCLLYEMAAGAMPFQATATTSMEEQHLSVPPPPPRSRNPWLSEEIERVILKAMAKKPEDRFQSCEEFAAALEAGVRSDERRAQSAEADRGRREAVEQKTIPERPAEDGRRPRPGAERHPVLDRQPAASGRRPAVVTGIVAGLVLAAVAGFLLLRGRAGPPEFPMPDLSGMSRAAAQGLVRGRGLVPVAAESTLTDAVAKDAVVSFLPAAGATVERGDTVRLTWSWGRKTCPECRTVRKGAARFCTKCGYSF